MFENMQKFLKICNNTSKYAENIQKSRICKNKFLNFCLIYSYFGSFKLLAYIFMSNMQICKIPGSNYNYKTNVISLHLKINNK